MRNVSSSSPSQLSSPPSALSEPASPTRYVNKGRANIEMGEGDEIVVDTVTAARFGLAQPAPPPQPAVKLTAAGLPRKKPGRKPGTVMKPKEPPADGSGAEAPKVRKPRKPRDPNAPPIQRKRKAAAVDVENAPSGVAAAASAPATSTIESRPMEAAAVSRQPKIAELGSMRSAMEPPKTISSSQQAQPTTVFSSAPVKRESGPSSMANLLNDDAPQQSRTAFPTQSTPPVSTTRQIFDPVRGNYDPVRETMVARDPYGTNASLGSPRAPSQNVNRASASPSIASLVDAPMGSLMSPGNTPQHSFHNPATSSRVQDSTSMPPSPIQAVSSRQAAKPPTAEVKKPAASISATAAKNGVETTRSGFTTLAASSTAPSAPSKRLSAVAQQDKQNRKGTSTASSSPKVGSLKDALPALPSGSERSILDFGKAVPGEEAAAPSIVLHIPLNGETNKYVNFMRMAEDRYGWDALHPRQAAHRDRKARIAAASAALEKAAAGHESGDDASDDDQSDGDGSNVEMGGMGNGKDGGLTSGPDGETAKPKRKKRNFKEDEYDRDDDFVDDSEMLWEEQAAASKDGFFVYSGPLVPEVEKPAAGYVSIVLVSPLRFEQ
jgi:hypothetical protein